MSRIKRDEKANGTRGNLQMLQLISMVSRLEVRDTVPSRREKLRYNDPIVRLGMAVMRWTWNGGSPRNQMSSALRFRYQMKKKAPSAGDLIKKARRLLKRNEQLVKAREKQFQEMDNFILRQELRRRDGSKGRFEI
jgi:hypothetical protein